jgi:hypothetical protein
MRDLSRVITPRLKFVHDPRRYSGCARSQPGFGRARIFDTEAMPKRLAVDGEVTEGVMATYEHGEQAAAWVAADLREGIQEMVAVNLMPSIVWSLRFTGHGFPTIDNVELLRAEAQFWTLGEGKLRHLLQDTSPRTAVEAGDGYFPAVKAKTKVSRLSSASELAAIFDECVMPSQLQQSTRINYWGSWKTVLTWGSRPRGDQIFASHEPRDAQGLYSGDAHGGLRCRNHSESVVGHRGQASHLWVHASLGATRGDFSRFSKAVASVKGMPSRLIFPIGVHHIQRLLELIGLTIVQRRDMLICVVGTVMVLRVNEVDQLQICDVLWYLDAAFHAKYQNTFACRLYKR